ncbi:MAG: VTT domain-containing protein [Dongiaceae bacterium]
MSAPSLPAPPPRRALRRWLPLAGLAAGLALFFALGLQRYVSFDALCDNRAWLLQQVSRHFLPSLLAYAGLYVLAVALSLPGGAVLTMAGGFLFGQWLGTAVTVVAATVGATILFAAARSAVGGLLRAKAGPWLKRLEQGFRRDAVSYLLVLRLVPLFPFFVVNLVPAFLDVPAGLFVWTTLVGIIPGTFVFATVGAGLGSVFDRGQPMSPADVLTPQIVTALLGLAVLALIPVAYKRLLRRRHG